MSVEQSGVSAAYVDRAVSSVRGELLGEINALSRELDELKAWTRSELQRMEREMREVGEMIVGAIDRQTTVLVGGVAATTAMIERTKQQIEVEFERTVGKLEIQTESTLQIEVGKKLADASALKSKLDSFVGDIKARFDRSIAAVAVNRELYNLNFRKITEEYQSKIATIGDHILKIRLEDIAPAVKAAEVSYETAHSLPIEMDLKRLEVRSENLDETLRMLKSSRLDEVVSSLETLDRTLGQFSADGVSLEAGSRLYVEAIATSSRMDTKVLAARTALGVADGAGANLASTEPSLSGYDSTAVRDKVAATMSGHRFRDLSADEVRAMARAVASLSARGLVSDEARALFEDFLGSGNLKIQEA